MEIGTIKPLNETVRKKKIRQKSGGFSNSGKGGGKNPGGGGGDDSGNDHEFEYLSDDWKENAPDKFRVGMWFILFVVLMTFGGLLSAYIVIATNGVIEWRPFALPVQVWISTTLIVASSFTYHVSKNAQYVEDQLKAKKWLLITTALGATFISSQIILWIELVRQGVYVQSNPYAGFFYILTAVHALHVIGGIFGLGYMVLKTWQQTDSAIELKKRKSYATTIGWYWHFMDGLWIILLILLGFWK